MPTILCPFLGRKEFESGKLITLDSIDTLATSLGAKTVTKKALEWSKVHSLFPQIVSDKEAVEAILQFANQHRILVKPACGAALALIYSNKINAQIYQKILVVVCGGSGVTRRLMEEWKTQLRIK